MKQIDSDGTIRYYNKQKQLHRLDGPAIIAPRSHQAWYLNGQLHRTDGPALIWHDGTEFWFVNGQLHRLDGPAITDTKSNSTAWYIHGTKYTQDEFHIIKFMFNY